MSLSLVLGSTRTSGVGPLAVTLNALATTSTNQANPFKNILYQWVFGDALGSPISGTTWATGALPGISPRNMALGPVVVHCFERPGSYTVRCNAWDGTEYATATIGITVTDPDTFYSTTNTVCFENTATGTGGPAGASYVTTSSWDTVLSAILQNKRCLCKRGDSFNYAGTTTDVGANGPWTVGAYGSGVDPTIVAQANGLRFCPGPTNSGSTQRTDVRWMDLRLNPNGHTGCHMGRQTDAPAPNTSFFQILFLRLVATARFASGDGIEQYSVTEAYAIDCVIDCSFYGLFWYNTLDGTQQASADCGILGCSVTNDHTLVDLGHTVRFIHHHRAFVGYNTLTGGMERNHVLKMAGAEDWSSSDSYTEDIVISENKIVGAGSGTEADWLVTLTSVNSDHDYRTRRLIFENNWLVASGSVSKYLALAEISNAAIRNNFIDASNFDTTAFNDSRAFWVFRRVTGVVVPVPDDVDIYNNTVYSTHTTVATSPLQGVMVEDGATNVRVKNFIVYTPNATNTEVTNSAGAGTGYVESNNTLENGVPTPDTQNDPLFVGGGSSPANFKLQSSSPYRSYGDDTVAVFTDMFGTYRKQGVAREGGMHEYDEGTDFPWDAPSTSSPLMGQALL